MFDAIVPNMLMAISATLAMHGLRTNPPSAPADDARRDDRVVPLIQCIDQFYNPKMYNWLSFKNNCNVAVHVVFVPNVPGKGGSAMHLKPGQADSTGFSKKEVDARAGFSLAVCAEGYHPVEANGQYWTHARETYSCKKD